MDRILAIQTLTKHLIILTGIAILFFAAVFALSLYLEQRFMLTWAAFLCGIIGGFVSIQQRIPRLSDRELALLTRSWFQMLLIPIFGGVFSLVLYGLFLAGIVSGNLFPAFSLPAPPETGPDSQFMKDIFTMTYPSTGQDLAKFLFWSFVAGFSERFVPQIVVNVSGNAENQTAPPQSMTSGQERSAGTASKP